MKIGKPARFKQEALKDAGFFADEAGTAESRTEQGDLPETSGTEADPAERADAISDSLKKKHPGSQVPEDIWNANLEEAEQSALASAV